MTNIKSAVLLLLLSFAALAQSPPADPATVLARILAEKGAITSADLSKVETAAEGERVTILAGLLQQKGLLTGADLARLSIAPRPPAPPPPQGPQQKQAPPVVAQSKVPVTLYGNLLLNAFMDTAGMNIQDVPLFTGKQGSDPSGGDKSFGMTARQSRFGLRYQGPNVGGAAIGGQVEVDFFGGSAALANGVNMDLLRLRLAYGRLDWQNFSLEAGQDWSVFAPLNPTSLAEYAIPSLSTSGNLWIRTPQIRAEYRESLGDSNRLVWQIAATDPNMGDYSTTTFQTVRTPGIGERGRMPAADARLAFTTRYDGRDFSFGLSSHYGHGKNFGTIGTQNVQTSVDSWGVALDYSLPVTSFLALTGEAFEGRALGIFSGASGEAVGPPGTPGRHGVETRGGWAQAQINFTHKWQTNLAYGIEVPNASQLPVGNRSRNRTYMGNIMYKISPAFTWSWEYRRLLTDFRNQLAAGERGDQVNMALAYMF
jgi:hypothetical protein